MERIFRRKLQVFVWVVTMMLSVLLFSTCTEKAARVQEEELPEAEAALPSSTEEPQQSEGTDAAPADESAVPEPSLPNRDMKRCGRVSLGSPRLLGPE